MPPLAICSPAPVAQIAHTSGHVNCPACDVVRRRMIEPREFAELPFREAAAQWLAIHSRSIGEGSIRDYRDCIRRLTEFFSALTLREIHIGHFEQYQRNRQEGTGGLRKAGASRVNHELNTLSQILARANLWAAIMPHYKPLRLPRSRVGRALTEAEEKNLFAVAASRPRWKVAYLCALITGNTTCNARELRMLRLQDVDLTPQPPSAPFGLVHVVDGSKNDYRFRPIPLNRTAHLAFRKLIERAQELGAVRPEHFLLPHRADHYTGKRRGEFDPSRPMYAWRKAWDALRAAAGLPNLRYHDLRHHVITKLLENGNVSERTVIEMAGHVSKAMLNRYSHIRLRAKLEAVLALEEPQQEMELPEKKPPAAVTLAPGTAKVQ